MSTSEVVTLIFSGIVAVSTVVYAILTRQLVVETQLLRKAGTAPHIGVYLRPSDAWVNIFDVVIENHGQGPAYQIEWDAGLGLDEKRKKGVHIDFLGNLDGLTYMAPGQRIQSFFGSAVDLLQHDPAPTVTLRLDYRDAQGSTYQSTYVLDPSKYEGQSRVGGHPAHEMAKALDKISKLLGQVVKQSRINVLTMTQEERRQEEERHRKAFEARRRPEQGPQPEGTSDEEL